MADELAAEADPVSSAPTAASVGKDALLYLPGRVAPAVVQVLTVTVLASFFSSDEIGHYDLALRFVVLLTTVTAIWLSMSVLRLHAAYAKDGRDDVFLRTVGRVRNGAMVLGVIGGALVYWFGPESIFGTYRQILPAGLFAFVMYGAFEIGLSVLRARRQPMAYSIATSLNALIRLPFAVLLFKVFHFGVSGMMWALGATYLIVYAVVVWPATRPGLSSTAPAEAAAMRRDILAYGWPILGTQVLNFFVVNLDRYLLKLMRGDADVGLYAIGTNLVDQPMALVLQTFALAVIPGVAIAWETRGRAATEDLMAGLTRIYLLISGLMIALLLSGAPHAFVVLARDKAAAASVAPWLCVAAFFYGLTYLSNLGLHLAKQTTQLLALTVIAMAVNAVANYVLIPRFGYDGAGMARVVANLLLAALFAVAGSRYLSWRFSVASTARIAAATGITAGAVWLLARELPMNLPGLVLLFGTGTLVYAALVVAIGEIPPRQLRTLLHVFTSRA